MSDSKQAVYVVRAMRSPVGKAPKGALRHTRPDDLLADVLKSVVVTPGDIDLSEIGDVIIGCAMPEAEQGMNVARISSLLAGLPDSVPGMTINRFCASGLQSIALAAQQIALGQADLMVAGGTESMSQVPMGGHKMTFSPKVFADNEQVSIAYGMGLTAEKVAERWQISREVQDQFALQSHERALVAQENGWFNEEIVPLTLARKTPNETSQMVEASEVEFVQDEGPRAGSSLESLARLKPVFSAKGSITAGNTSQMSDGAGVVLLANEQALLRYNLTPMARFCGFAVAGVAPEVMGIGPVEAIPKALNQAGLTLNDMEWIELNEAFAAQALAVMQMLELDPERVNPQGGAIALGHPLGATGAIRTATLLHGLKHRSSRYGMVTMCIGTGMGAAGVFESLH